MEMMEQQWALIDIIYFLMQGCIIMKNLEAGKCIHSFIVMRALDFNAVWGGHLFCLYTSCTSVMEARQASSKVSQPSLYSWKAVISTHSKHGKSETALKLYEGMMQEGVTPDKAIFLYVLKACSNIRSIDQGRQIHDQIVRSVLTLDVTIGNTLVDMYAKCERIEDAGRVFHNLPNRDVVSWSSMIGGYVHDGHSHGALQMYEKMQKEGIKPGRVTFLCTLKACSSIGAIEKGRLIHDEIIRSELDTDITIGNTLVDVYSKCDSLVDAHKVFDKLQNQDTVSWAAIVAGCALHGHAFSALKLYERMQLLGIQPNKATLICILKACGSMGAVGHGKEVHDHIITSGLKLDLVIGSALLDMYTKFGKLDDACRVLDELPNRDVVSWTSVIAGYAKHGHGQRALQFFEKMQQEGINPSKVTFSCLLRACSSMGSVEQGRLIHDQIIMHELDLDVVIGNTLIDTYAKCGSIEEARKVFDGLQYRDEVSWGTVIAGYDRHEYGYFAVELVEKMLDEGIKPGKITVLCILKACGSIGATGQGNSIHDHIVRSGLDTDVNVGNSLVGMYAKCGSLEEAGRMFEKIPSRDVVSWGVMIALHAVHGNYALVGEYVENMQHQGLKPDNIIFTSILTACSHAGLLEEGLKYFRCMTENHGLVPSIEHYSCILNLLGRAGCLKEAEDFLRIIPIQPEVVLWRSLLTSCRTYSNLAIGRRCFHEIIQLDPSDASGYVLMSCIYADANMWADAEEIEEMRRHAGAQKKSWEGMD